MRLVNNLGSTMVYLFLYSIALLILPLSNILGKNSVGIKKLSLVLKKHLIWNGIINLIIK
jgi:hypothetical protein